LLCWARPHTPLLSRGQCWRGRLSALVAPAKCANENWLNIITTLRYMVSAQADSLKRKQEEAGGIDEWNRQRREKRLGRAEARSRQSERTEGPTSGACSTADGAQGPAERTPAASPMRTATPVASPAPLQSLQRASPSGVFARSVGRVASFLPGWG
jgi:hypothetical protein